MNLKKKQILLADVDGTIFMESLLMRHYDLLIKNGIVPKSELLELWKADKKNDGLIYKTATEYRESLKSITLETATQYARVLMNEISDDLLNDFSISMINKFKQKGQDIVLISGSPKFIVKEFAKLLGVKGYGSIYQTDKQGYFNGEILGMWGAEHKSYLINHLELPKKYEKIISLGDSVGDFGMFEHSHKAYLIEPNEEAETKGKSKYKNIIVIR